MPRSPILLKRLLVLFLLGAVSSVTAIAQSGSSAAPSSTSTAVSPSFTSLATTTDSYYDWVGIGLAGAVGVTVAILAYRHHKRAEKDATTLNELEKVDNTGPSRFLRTPRDPLFPGAAPEGALRSSSSLRARALNAFGIKRHLTGFFQQLGKNTQLSSLPNNY